MVIPVGAAAQGEVVASEGSGAVMKRGKLAVRITSITLGGQSIPLDMALETKGKGGKNDDLWRTVLAPTWALFARGNSAKLKAGELLTAEVAGSICFTHDIDAYLPAPCPDDPASAAQSAAGG